MLSTMFAPFLVKWQKAIWKPAAHLHIAYPKLMLKVLKFVKLFELKLRFKHNPNVEPKRCRNNHRCGLLLYYYFDLSLGGGKAYIERGFRFG